MALVGHAGPEAASANSAQRLSSGAGFPSAAAGGVPLPQGQRDLPSGSLSLRDQGRFEQGEP